MYHFASYGFSNCPQSIRSDAASTDHSYPSKCNMGNLVIQCVYRVSLTERSKSKRSICANLRFGLQAYRGHRLDIGADAAAACEHLPHGDGAVKVELVVIWQRRGQLQVLLLNAAVAEALAAISQAVRLREVKWHVVVRAGRAERL